MEETLGILDVYVIFSTRYYNYNEDIIKIQGARSKEKYLYQPYSTYLWNVVNEYIKVKFDGIILYAFF